MNIQSMLSADTLKASFYKLHFSVFIAGFTGVFGRLISLSEGLLVWWRMLITCVLLVLLLGAMKKLRRVPWRAALRMALAGSVLATHWLFFYASIKYSTVSIGVVCFSLCSFFTALIEPLFDRKRINVREVAYSVIALVGVAVIFGFDSRYRVGIALGTLSSLLAALYSILNKRASVGYASSTVLMHQLTFGLLWVTLLLPLYLYLFPQPTFFPQGSDIVYLLLFSLFCTVLLYILQIQVLKRISAFTVNLAYNMEPLYSILVAMVIFNEASELNFSFYGGLLLILASVVLQSWSLVRMSKKIAS